MGRAEDDYDDADGGDRAAASLRCEDCVRSVVGSSSSSSELVELGRLVHCAAYNMLTAVISSTQTDSKFYTGFLFPHDNLAKVSSLPPSLRSLCRVTLIGHLMKRGVIAVVVNSLPLTLSLVSD